MARAGRRSVDFGEDRGMNRDEFKLTLPEDPEELRSFTARLLAEVKAQAILIESEERSCVAGSSRPVDG